MDKKTYLLDILNRYNRLSDNLDIKTVLCLSLIHILQLLSTMADLGIIKTLANQSSKQETRELIILKHKFKKQDVYKRQTLDMAERMAKRHIPMTMEDWARRIDIILEAGDNAVLIDAGKVTAEFAKSFAESEFEKYRIVQDRLFCSDFDRFDDNDILPLDF